ncbi:MAG: hypothetical protein PHN82_02560 [bacterium]|nr:hypothetical protein [bacterium]
MRIALAAAAGALAVGCAAPARASGMDLPESFKGTVPLFAGSTVAMAVQHKEGDQAHLECAALAAEVVAFYRKSMTEKGWSEDAVVTLPQGQTAVFSKEKRTLAVTALDAGDGTCRVVLVLAPEE